MHFLFLGDLAFGSPFGMIRAGKDSAPVALSTKDAIAAYSSSNNNTSSPTIASLPAGQILNARGDFSASLGVIPPVLRPLVTRFIPWFKNGNKAVKSLAGLAVAAVARRLASEESQVYSGSTSSVNVNEKVASEEDDLDIDIALTDAHRTDLLAKLREGKDERGEPMGREELTAEALTQLIAGSDTTSK